MSLTLSESFHEPRETWSGPIAAQFSVDDDGWLRLDDVATEFRDDEEAFRETWSSVGRDLVNGCGDSRKLFIVFGRLVWTRYSSGDYGFDYDCEFDVAGEW